jgi:hypothetical protein
MPDGLGMPPLLTSLHNQPKKSLHLLAYCTHVHDPHLLVEHRLGLTTKAGLLAVVTPLACISHAMIYCTPWWSRS